MYEIILPKIEANTEEAVVTQWLKKENEEVKKGEPLFLMETVKAVIEVEAETSGVLRKILVPERQNAKVLQVVALIGNKDEPLPDLKKYAVPPKEKEPEQAKPLEPKRVEEVKLSAETAGRVAASPAAKRLAREQGIDLAAVQRVAGKERIGEEDVQLFISVLDRKGTAGERQRVLVIGASMGAEVVSNILRTDPNLEIIGYLDDNPKTHGQRIFDRPVLGPTSMIEQLYNEKKFDSVIVSITSNVKVRKMLFDRCRQNGYRFVNAVHPTAYIDPTARVGEGNIICAFVHIGCKAVVGDNNLLSAHTDIEHHNKLGSHNAFGPHCSTSGDVKIGDTGMYGTGIFIQPHITIGSDANIASGSVILNDVPDGGSVKAKLKG